MQLRRIRRIAGGMAVGLFALVGWDQSGILRVGAVVEDRSAEVAGVSYARAGELDLDALSIRLRLPETPAAPDSAAADVPVEVIAGDGEIAIAPPPRVFAKPAVAPPPPRPPAQLRTTKFDGVTPAGGTWAVLVGINDYPGDGHDLRSAITDVGDVNEALAKWGVTNDRRLVLRDGQATAGMIRASLEWLTAHAGPDATAVFFYAGHVQKVSATTEAIVGSDGEVLADHEVASLLAPLQARRTWIALAACYSGGFTEVQGPGRIVTAAAGPDSLAYESARFGRSYLVEYMVRRAMLEKGIATVEGAFASAVADLRRDHPNRLPVQHDQVGGDFDLRTAPPTGGAPAPAAPPSSPGPASGPPSSGGSSPSPSPTPSEPAGRPSGDGCADLTVHMVRCSY